VFHKGGTLYNLHAAKHAIRKDGSVIVVEGYFDVLRLVLAGIEHVVAPLGTALTPEQAGLLRRYTSQAILLLDSDMAGLRATFRAGDELLRHEMRVRVATMPPGEDPDTVVRRGGAAALEPILKDAVDIMERKIQLLDRKGWFTGIEHRRDALDRLLPTIRATKDPIQRELYLSLVAERSGVDKKVLEAEAASTPSPPVVPSHRAAEPPSRRPTDPARTEWARTERKLLRLLLTAETWRATAAKTLTSDLFRDPVHREMFEHLRLAPAAGTPAPPDDASEAVRQRWQSYLDAGAPVQEPAMDQLYADALNALESRPHLERMRQLARELPSAARDRIAELIAEQRQLKTLLETRYPKPYRTYYPLIRSRASRRS
jgi:DNA primase